MTAIRATFLAFLALLSVPVSAAAQMATVPCIDTCPGNLRSLTSSPGNYVFAAGYYQPGGLGAGSFYMGAGPSTFCPTVPQAGATWSAGSTTIAVTSLAGISPGMAITAGQAGLPAYDVIISTTALTITLAAPTTAPGSGVTIYFSNDNGGSIVRDNEPTPVCYYRATWNYNPGDYGAHGDGVSDDTAPMQNFFNARQPHYGVAGTFMVTSPLTCPADTTVQGPANLEGQAPLFTIAAAAPPNFSGVLPLSETSNITAQGVIGALSYCRLSGVNVTGNSYYLPTTAMISNASSCITSVASTHKLALGNYVVGANVPAQTTVTSIGTCSGTSSVGISNPISCPTGCGPQPQAITFYGPDVADLLDTRVTIDGFSALSGGGNDLVCINTSVAGIGVNVRNTRIGDAENNDVYINGGCPNIHFVGAIIARAGQGHGTGTDNAGISQVCGPGSTTCQGTGLFFTGDEMTFSDGEIQESQGIGLDLEGSERITVSANHIEGNGEGPAGGAAIRIGDSHTISICANHFEGNGGDVPNSAQIYFGGLLDNVDLCSNVYETESLADVTLRPLYVYDADPLGVFTNMHIYDAPAPQASGQVYTTNALALLPQLQVPHSPLGQISGLVLTNDTSTATKVNVATGEASNSTNSVTIENSLSCPVDLANGGANGLDSGAGMNAANTTYFYFLIGNASGGNPSCMASASPIPTFANTTGYSVSLSGATYAGLPYIYNLPSIAGLAAGQAIQNNSYMPSGTTIASVGTLTIDQLGNFATSTTITIPGGIGSMAPLMAISDSSPISGSSCTPAGAIKVNDTIAALGPGSNQITLTNGITGTLPSNDCITVSGGNTVTLSANATSSTTVSFTIFTGLYRMIGALYTDASKNVVQFSQDGDTFYLAKSVADIVTGSTGSICVPSVGPGPISCPLSVPCGRTGATCMPTGGNLLKVEALGRIVGGTAGDILLSSLDQAIQAPMPFPNTPGYSTSSSSTSTSFPFRIYTDGGGKVRVQGSAGSVNTVYEITDGWVLHR